MRFKTQPSNAPLSVAITGASSGLGSALAMAYACKGCVLHLLGRDEVRLAAIASACEARGAHVFYASIDVRDRDSMSQWLRAQDVLHPIDIVIANAGISAGTGDGEENEMQARLIFEVNVQGVMNTVWPLIPAMQMRRRGGVAIISSLAGCYPIPNAPAYSASKASLRYYGEALRAQLASSGVRVMMAYPGFIETPMTRVNPFPMPMLMHPDDAAQRIMHAIACGKPRIFFPYMLGLLVRALHFLPMRAAQNHLMRVPSKPRIS